MWHVQISDIKKARPTETKPHPSVAASMSESGHIDPVVLAMVMAIVTPIVIMYMHQKRAPSRSRQTASAGPLPPSHRGFLPYVGVALTFFKDINAFLDKKRTEHPNDGPFRFLVAGKWWSVVYATEDIKLVLNGKESELSFLKGFEELMEGLLPKAFTFVPRHHFFLPLFREGNMEWFCRLLAAEVEIQVPLLFRLPAYSHDTLKRPVQSLSTPSTPENASSNLIDLFETCRHVVMRLNLRVLLGPRVLRDGLCEQYYAAFDTIDPEKGLVDTMTSLLLGPQKKEEAWATLREITREVLEHYEEKESDARGGGYTNDGTMKAQGAQEQQEAPECVLDLLVRQSNVPLDVEEVAGDVFAFVLAAFTNTYAVLAWSLWELAGNPEVRERFLAECGRLQQQKEREQREHHPRPPQSRGREESYPEEKLLERNDETVTSFLAEVDGCKVARAIIEEVIRLHTPGLFFRKVVAPSGILLSTGHQVPVGDFLAFSARYIHTSPALHTNPDRFDIERHLMEREKKRADLSALQWGGGRHPCLGARFAVMEMVMIMRRVYQGGNVRRVTEMIETHRGQLGTSDKPVRPVYVALERAV